VEILGDEGEFHHMYIPTSALKTLIDALNEIGRGNAVNILSTPAELSISEAAEVLDCSAAEVIQLLKDRCLTSRREGTGRRLPYQEVINRKRKLDARMDALLAELDRIGQEMENGSD